MKNSASLLLKNPLWFYITNNKRAFFLGMFFLLITNILDGLYPLLMKVALDQIEAKNPLSDIGRTCAILFILMSALAFSRLGWRIFFGKFHTYAAEDLRSRLFAHITRLSPRFFQKNPVGELMSLVTNDVQAFRQAIGPGVLILADGIIIILVILPIMASLNWSWTWKTLILLPLIPFLIWKVTRLIFINYKLLQDKFSELTGISQETVGGIRVIKGYAQEENRIHLFNSVSSQFERACNKVAKLDAMFVPVMELGVTSGSVILLFVAQEDLFSGSITIGTFVAFQRYIQKMVWPMTALGLGLSQFQKGFASFARIREALETSSDIQDTGTLEVGEFKNLEFKNVTFTYPESRHASLQNVSFRIQAGENLGIMGAVGSGKSTLINLLIRLYQPDSGQILVNDIPIEQFRLASLRSTFAMVPQDSFLFSNTIAENLSFGLPVVAEEEALRNMLKAVDLTQEVESLPHQLQSELGERGVNLSGGQKQRLTIARALMIQTPVIILDDSLSAVDTKTERLIESQISGSQNGRSRIVIAHRLSSIQNVEKLLVLKDGQVEAFGTREEVEKISPIFQTIAAIQEKESHT